MTVPPTADDWDPNEFSSVEDRASEYARLRATCPVAHGRNAWGAARFWSLMRYRDIVSAVRDTKSFSNSALARLEIRRAPLESDPPEHGQIRRLLNPLLSPKAMTAREPMTRRIARDHVAAFVQQGGGDAVAAISRPIPTKVLLSWLGQPIADWEAIKRSADASRPQQLRDDPARARMAAAERALWDYSWDLIRDRQANPRDPDTDPVSAMLAGKLDGGPMPEQHAVGMVRLVLAAGHDSTSQAVGIVLHFLAKNPDVQRILREDHSLIRAGIEEILRLNSPVVAMPRTVVDDVRIGDRQLCTGDRVLLNWASANRDPEVFHDAETWRIDRERNPHMVFGHGIHSCAGAPLARQELQVVAEEMFAHCSGFALAGEATVQDMQQYGFASLPLKVTV